MEEKIITIDLTGCKYLGELHERIRVAFDFTEWYGQNWSAFYDLLRSDCDADKIVVKGISSVSKELEQCVDKMKEIMEREQSNCARRQMEMFEIVYFD